MRTTRMGRMRNVRGPMSTCMFYVENMLQCNWLTATGVVPRHLLPNTRGCTPDLSAVVYLT